ncbi:hypothetical protein JTB14_004586 [Gonioctena quinquepunctata]|nr:hypothetical protein JTB14_004586 [Gonioctena quinquepunctata]
MFFDFFFSIIKSVQCTPRFFPKRNEQLRRQICPDSISCSIGGDSNKGLASNNLRFAYARTYPLRLATGATPLVPLPVHIYGEFGELDAAALSELLARAVAQWERCGLPRGDVHAPRSDSHAAVTHVRTDTKADSGVPRENITFSKYQYYAPKIESEH